MFERRADRWQAGLVMGALLLGLWAWMQVPAEMQVPIHFDMRGVPDGWGSPAMAFVFLPVLAAAMWGLRGLIEKVDPGPGSGLQDRARVAQALDRVFLAVTGLLVAAQALIVVVALTAWRPAAVHFLPVLALFLLVVGSAVFPLVDPRDPQLAASGRAVGTIRWAVLGLLAVMFAIIARESLGSGPATPELMLLALGAIFIVIGNVMGKLRPNARVGIRTRWTLANSRVWDQTHRFGGKAQVLAGAVLLGLAFTPLPLVWHGPAIALVALAAAGVTVLKSYLLWRALPTEIREPQRDIQRDA